MVIKLQDNPNIKGYKINKSTLTKSERDLIERVNRDSFFQELHQIFEQYRNCLEAYKLGYTTKWQKEKTQNELYEKSGYSDIYDFFYDYCRWSQGLPIYIKFELV